jgi:hypothetical protein
MGVMRARRRSLSELLVWHVDMEKLDRRVEHDLSAFGIAVAAGLHSGPLALPHSQNRVTNIEPHRTKI